MSVVVITVSMLDEMRWEECMAFLYRQTNMSAKNSNKIRWFNEIAWKIKAKRNLMANSYPSHRVMWPGLLQWGVEKFALTRNVVPLTCNITISLNSSIDSVNLILFWNKQDNAWFLFLLWNVQRPKSFVTNGKIHIKMSIDALNSWNQMYSSEQSLSSIGNIHPQFYITQMAQIMNKKWKFDQWFRVNLCYFHDIILL